MSVPGGPASAEQAGTMSRRIFIDLTRCDECETCAVDCGYHYRPAATEHGVLGLRERAAFMLVCRRCEDPSCSAACRFDALERQDSGVMKRYNMRCVSCKCCSHACPFGTIYPETVPFYVTNCDFCLATADEGAPPCSISCAKDAIGFRDVEESPEDNVYVLSDHLAVRAPKWDKKDV